MTKKQKLDHQHDAEARGDLDLEECFAAARDAAGECGEAVRRFVGAMLAVAAAVVGPGMADDAFQEWWLRRFPGICLRYDGCRSFRAYALDSFRRFCGEYRRWSRRRHIPALPSEPADHRQNPLRDKRSELRGRIGSALRTMPKGQRQVVILQLKGRSLARAAARAGCTPNALYLRGARARRTLRTLLADIEEFLT